MLGFKPWGGIYYSAGGIKRWRNGTKGMQGVCGRGGGGPTSPGSSGASLHLLHLGFFPQTGMEGEICLLLCSSQETSLETASGLPRASPHPSLVWPQTKPFSRSRAACQRKARDKMKGISRLTSSPRTICTSFPAHTQTFFPCSEGQSPPRAPGAMPGMYLGTGKGFAGRRGKRRPGHPLVPHQPPK